MAGNHLSILHLCHLHSSCNLLNFSYLLKLFYQLLSPTHLIYLPALHSKSRTLTPVLSSAGSRRQTTFPNNRHLWLSCHSDLEGLRHGLGFSTRNTGHHTIHHWIPASDHTLTLPETAGELGYIKVSDKVSNKLVHDLCRILINLNELQSAGTRSIVTVWAEPLWITP